MPAARLPHTPRRDGVVRVLGATLIDGTLAEPVPDAEVEYRDGRISYAGPRRAVADGDATVIDAAGGFVLPGFIDAHVHLSMSHDATEEEQRRWFPEERAFATASTMRQTLHAGVTTARDLSGLAPGYRNAVAAGRIDGPRMHLAIALLSPTGGHADPLLPNGTVPLWAERATTPGWAVVDTADEVVKAVRALARTGADVIKVCTTGGMSTPHDSPEEPGIPEEHVALIVAEMNKRQGQPVTAHAQSDAGVRAAVLGGAASVEHGYELSDDTIELMRARGTVLVPTLSTLLRIRDPLTMSIDARSAREFVQQTALDAIGRAVAAGVTVALGTDAGIHPQGHNLTELGHLVGVGLSPLEAIHAGTLAGARMLRLAEHLGSVEVGKLADLVITEVDPLADPAAIGDPQTVRLVIQSGRIVKDLR